MMKAVREIQRLAESCGIEDAVVEAGDPHGRICGYVRGSRVEIVVSLSKALATQRTVAGLKSSIRSAVRRAGQ